MKLIEKYCLRAVLVVILLVEVSGDYVRSQDVGGVREQVYLAMDRSLYATGERIFFSVCPLHKKEFVSSIIYVEIMGCDGSSIVQKSFYLEDMRVSGSVDIPADLASGTYYLRAYSRWMRNFHPAGYAYAPFIVFNPRSAETVKVADQPSPQDVTLKSSEGIHRAEIIVQGLKDTYTRREEMNFSLSGGEKDACYFVSISREGTEPFRSGILEAPIDIAEYISDPEYIPEIRGRVLEGRILHSETGEPCEQGTVFLSTTPAPVYFASARSNAGGHFWFNFPRIGGEFDCHLEMEKSGGDDCELKIDPGFCRKGIVLPFVPFNPDSAMLEVMKSLSIHEQIRERFLSRSMKNSSGIDSVFFYGRPDRTILVRDYIELKNIREFLYELVLEASVRSVDGRKNIFLANHSTYTNYPVLLLVDNIRIENIDELLETPSARIRRIDVINQPYAVGMKLYSGILALYSEQQDAAGLPVNEESLFFSVGMPVFSDERASMGVDRMNIELPDFRNTLLFETFVDPEEGRMEVSASTGDASGSYILSVSGVDREGNIFICDQKEIIIE